MRFGRLLYTGYLESKCVTFMLIQKNGLLLVWRLIPLP